MTTTIAAPILDVIVAREMMDQLKAALTVAADLVIDLWRGQAWDSLKYPSWEACCEAELGANRIFIPANERLAKMAPMRAAGMSLRAIGAGTGFDKRTVARTLATGANAPVEKVTGLNGKTYAPRSERDSLPRPDDIHPLDTVSACGVDDSFRDALKSVKRWLKTMTDDPTPTQAQALIEVLQSAIRKLERI